MAADMKQRGCFDWYARGFMVCLVGRVHVQMSMCAGACSPQAT